MDIRFEKLFPFQFQVVGYALLMAGVILVPSGNLIIGLALCVAGFFITTAYSGTEIDPHHKTIREYNAYFFIKTGKATPYNGIEKLFINSNKVSQKLYTAHTLNSTTFRGMEFNAYLKLESGEKILLLRMKDKAKLLKKLDPISAVLNTPLSDLTTHTTL